MRRDNLYFELKYRDGANESLKQRRIKTRFQRALTNAWEESIRILWWAILEYNDRMYLNLIRKNLDDFSLKKKNKTVAELFDSNEEGDFKFRIQYDWNAFHYVIEVQLPKGDESISEPEIMKFGLVTMAIVSDQALIQDATPFILKIDYNKVENLTEYRLDVHETSDDSQLLMQTFIHSFENLMHRRLKWIIQEGITVNDILALEHNIPEGDVQMIDETMNLSQFHLQSHNSLSIELKEDTEEILKKKRKWGKFKGSLNRAWRQTSEIVETYLPIYRDGLLLRKLQSYLDQKARQICGKPLESLKNEVHRDFEFLDFFELFPENYIVRNADSVPSFSYIPGIALYKQENWEFASLKEDPDLIFALQLFYIILQVKLDIWTKWLVKEELSLSTLVTLQINFQIDNLNDMKGIYHSIKEEGEKIGFIFSRIASPPIEISDVCVFDQAIRTAHEWLEKALESIKTDNSWSVISKFQYEFHEYYYYEGTSLIGPNKIQALWKPPDWEIPKYLHKYISEFFGCALYLIEHRLGRISTLYNFDWKQYYKLELFNIHPVECEDPDDRKLTYPRLTVKILKTDIELKKLRIKGFVTKGFRDVIWSGVEKHRKKYEAKDSFEARWITQSGLDICVSDEFKRVIIWLDTESNQSSSFFFHLITYFQKHFEKHFQQKGLKWEEFIQIFQVK